MDAQIRVEQDACQPQVLVDQMDQPKFGRLRAGDTCPICQVDQLDYDGLLNLACTRCGFSLGGCFS